MDSIGQIFSSVPGVASGMSSGGGGGILSQIMPFMMLGGAGSSLVGNIMANRARNQVLSSEMSQMNALNKLTPGQVTSGITSLETPLSGNLINAVSNATQGEMAQRGLSQAPGIFSQAIAQGLAPYQLQEQQLAQDAFFKKLGLPISARPSPFGPFPQQSNSNQLWQSLFQRFQNQAQQPKETIPGVDNGIDAGLIQQWLSPSSLGMNMPFNLTLPTSTGSGDSASSSMMG